MNDDYNPDDRINGFIGEAFGVILFFSLIFFYCCASCAPYNPVPCNIESKYKRQTSAFIDRYYPEQETVKYELRNADRQPIRIDR